MMKKKINPEGIPNPPAPYTNVIKVDAAKEMLFLSGISATDEHFAIVGKDDILEQTRKIVNNITACLKAAGAGPENVVMTTTYVLSDHLEEFLTSGSASVLFEALDNPADTLVGVASLAGMKYGALIEVSAVAVLV